MGTWNRPGQQAGTLGKRGYRGLAGRARSDEARPRSGGRQPWSGAPKSPGGKPRRGKADFGFSSYRKGGGLGRGELQAAHRVICRHRSGWRLGRGGMGDCRRGPLAGGKQAGHFRGQTFLMGKMPTAGEPLTEPAGDVSTADRASPGQRQDPERPPGALTDGCGRADHRRELRAVVVPRANKMRSKRSRRRQPARFCLRNSGRAASARSKGAQPPPERLVRFQPPG